MNKKENIISCIIKTLAIAVSFYGLSSSFSSWKSLTYFTNLSNYFVDIVLIGALIFEIMILAGKGDRRKNWMYVVKFMATISITLTFLVYLCLLAPTDSRGFVRAYFDNGGRSFCVHFMGPLLAIIDFILFDYRFNSSKKHVFSAIIPPLTYVVYIIIVHFAGNVTWGDKTPMAAPYNFLNYEASCGWFGFNLKEMSDASLGIGVAYMIVILVMIFIGIGMGYLAIKNMVKKKH